MKKFYYILIILTFMFFGVTSVNAGSISVDTKELIVGKGKSSEFKITVLDALVRANIFNSTCSEVITISNAGGAMREVDSSVNYWISDMPQLAAVSPSRKDYVFTVSAIDSSNSTNIMCYINIEIFDATGVDDGEKLSSDIISIPVRVVKSYTVRFDANGGNEAPDSQVKLEPSGLILSSDIPKRIHYTFVGWNTKADGSGNSYSAGGNYNTNEDVILYAQWEKNTEYIISFDANGGIGSMDDQVFLPGEIKKLSENQFTREGYHFTGWNEDPNGKGESYSADLLYSMNEGGILYAQWEKNPGFDVTLYSNNGTNDVYTLKVISDVKQELMPASYYGFSKAGHTFGSWNTQADGEGDNYYAGTSYSFNADTTLYAIWEALEYTVTFNSNGGVGSMNPQEFLSGVDKELSENQFTRKGYRFKEWNTNAEGNGDRYSDQQVISITGNKTLYAIWEALEHDVTLYSNNGTNDVYTLKVISDVKQELMPASYYGFSKAGHTSDSWNTKADGTGERYYAGGSFSFSDNTTLYAEWAPLNYTVTFNSNGGVGSMNPQVFSYGVSQKLDANVDNITRIGYSFVGWNTKADGEGTSYIDKASITIRENITLYAMWVAKSYTVTYNGNGATAGSTSDQVFVYNKPSRVMENGFVKAGYTFVHWNTKSDGEGITYLQGIEDTIDAAVTNNTASEIVLYAIWDENPKYTITFNSNGGVGSMNPQVFVSGVEEELSANQFTKEDYRFKEWNTKADGSGEQYSDQQLISITGNKTLYAIWVAEDKFLLSINKYRVDADNKLVFVQAGTTYENFVSNVTIDLSKYYFNIEDKNVNNKKMLYTGSSFKVYSKTNGLVDEYHIVVLGDVNGDGISSNRDFVKIYNHLDEADKLNYLTGVYLKAADMTGDGQVTLRDYVKLYNNLGGM